jgi:hypothetical protein
MRPEAKDQKPGSAGKWGCTLVVLIALTVGLFAWSLYEVIIDGIELRYAITFHCNEDDGKMILELENRQFRNAMIPVLLSHLIWVVAAILLWRPLKKQQKLRNEGSPIIKIEQSFSEKFTGPREAIPPKSTDIEPQ